MIVTLKELGLTDAQTSQEQRIREVLEVKSAVITMEETLQILSPIVDNGQYQVLDVIETQVVKYQEVDYQTDIKHERCDIVVLLGDGANTIQILDWTVKSSTITKDPEIRIIGPDAYSILEVVKAGIAELLTTKILSKLQVEINQEALRELAALKEGIDVDTYIENVKTMAEEFRMLLKTALTNPLDHVANR